MKMNIVPKDKAFLEKTLQANQVQLLKFNQS